MTWPRCSASAATALPIFPLPIMAMRMVVSRSQESRLIRSKELTMQPSDNGRTILFPHHKGHVDGRSSLRDHLHVGRPYRIEDPGSQTRSRPETYSDYGDDGPPLLGPDLAQLGQIGQQHSEPRTVFDGERYADLPARQYVDNGLVPLEDLEEGPEEPVRPQHSRRSNIDHRDPALP